MSEQMTPGTIKELELNRDERKELKARARAQKRIAAGVKLCGARTRKGTPCIARPLPNGRCKFHGGALDWRKNGGRTGSVSLRPSRNYWGKRKAAKAA